MREKKVGKMEKFGNEDSLIRTALVRQIGCNTFVRLVVVRVYVGGRVYSCHSWPWSCDRRPLHPYNDGTEYVSRVVTHQADIVPSTKRREVLRESLEG